MAPEPAGVPGLTPPRSRTHSSRFVTDLIVELGYATREQVDAALEESRNTDSRAEEILLKRGIINDDHLSRAVAERYGLDHADLNALKIDMGAANLIDAHVAKRYSAVPVRYEDEKTVLLAVADPANVVAIDDIQMLTGLNCRVAVANRSDIDALVSRLSTLDSAVSEITEEEEEIEADISDIRESAEDAPTVKLVHSILGQAVTEGASDIHFEPEERDMRVRFRIDGVLSEATRVPKRLVAGVVSRVKIMADLDIAEKRAPQDGRVAVSVEDRQVDLRVVTIPTDRGEGATLRILDKDQALRSLDELGMKGTSRERFEAAINQPYGATLVTGPTGSGKSTTLYSALTTIQSVEKNIITIEDPVEYRIEGIKQMGVNPKAGLTFATGLRSILRADPDIIMVGEIRDAETARIAIESALTGHLVLSTLHTNDAPGAITRLEKMGVESFLTASAIDCVIAQRLARTLCSDCKVRTVLSREVLAKSNFQVDEDIEAYEPGGCSRCGGSGYKGRIGIYSVMRLSERIKDLTVAQAPEAEISKVAQEEGMLTLREAGIERVREGATSIAEVARVAA